MMVNGRRISLGCFSSKIAAVNARKEAESGHGFTERHGTKSVITPAGLSALEATQ